MKKYEEQKEVVRQSFTPSDYDSLRNGLKRYENKRGQFGSKFFQFLEGEKVIRFEKGELLVSSPVLYTQYSDMYSKIQAKDDAELMSFLEQYPEEKAAWKENIRKIGIEIRNIMKGMRVQYDT